MNGYMKLISLVFAVGAFCVMFFGGIWFTDEFMFSDNFDIHADESLTMPVLVDHPDGTVTQEYVPRFAPYDPDDYKTDRLAVKIVLLFVSFITFFKVYTVGTI